MAFQAAISCEQLWQGEMHGMELDGKKILLIHLGPQVAAFEDRCLHQSVRLSEKGRLEGDVLTCSVHGWQYDILSGRGLNPCNMQLKRYPAKIEEGMIYVDPESELPVGL